MKTKLFGLMLGLITLASCSNDSDFNEVVNNDPGYKQMSFNLNGEFKLSSAMTRSLTADEKDMTDVWVLDYMGDELVQQLHQSSSDEDFGNPTMSLQYGQHHIYFIASRGTGGTINTEDHTLIFEKVSDTFYKDLSLNVMASSSGNTSVVLDRAITKLKVVFTDEIAEGTSTLNITPHTWYYGIDYLTGNPTEAQTDRVIQVNVPESTYGKTNINVTVFGFSSSEEWTTDFSVNAKNSSDVVLGAASITDAPFKRNRITEYSGPLFGSGGSMTMSLNSTWDTDYTGTY